VRQPWCSCGGGTPTVADIFAEIDLQSEEEARLMAVASAACPWQPSLNAIERPCGWVAIRQLEAHSGEMGLKLHPAPQLSLATRWPHLAFARLPQNCVRTHSRRSAN